MCGRVRGNRRDRRTDVFRRCGDDAEVLGRSGAASADKLASSPGMAIACSASIRRQAGARTRQALCCRASRRRGAAGLGPIRGDRGQRFAGRGVVAAVEPQFPTNRQGIYKRPRRQPLQPRGPINVTETLCDGFVANLEFIQLIDTGDRQSRVGNLMRPQVIRVTEIAEHRQKRAGPPLGLRSIRRPCDGATPLGPKPHLRSHVGEYPFGRRLRRRRRVSV